MKQFKGSPKEWNQIIASLPHSHILQTWEWSQFKANYGWESNAFMWEEPETGSDIPRRIKAATMVLKRKIPIRGFSSRLNILYAPRGPIMDWSDIGLSNEVLNDLQSYAKKQSAIFLKIDAGVKVGDDSDDKANFDIGSSIKTRKELLERGWIFSNDQVQFRNTAVINLEKGEDQILSNCKQKTRYNIKLATKRGVTVRIGSMDDLELLYGLYAETSVRDGFVIREKGYYLTLWKMFMKNKPDINTPSAIPLIAEFEGTPLAAIMVFFFSHKAYYLYGMSSELHREKMPNHLLQWEAIKLAKSLGCRIYDLWGAPDELNECDPMWGVYRFKKGLGASLVQSMGAWDYPARPIMYKLYTQIIPKVLDIMRRRGKVQTKRSISME
jgi:peptidoglycan pentaglycine glycine transferase (the first glycine)